jgi:phenylalanyl-tRNA synthetase alpha chain
LEGEKLDLKEAAAGLASHEKMVLLILERTNGKASFPELVKQTGLDQSTVMRATLSLSERGLVNTEEKKSLTASLTSEGLNYARDGLPEKRMLMALAGGKNESVEEVARRAALDPAQAQIALAWLRRKNWAEFVKVGDKNTLLLTKDGNIVLSKKTRSETLLEKLTERDHDLGEISEDLKTKVDTLVKRGLVELAEKTHRTLELTPLGGDAVSSGIEVIEEVSELTRELLVSGKWKEVKLRRYDVLAPGAPVYPGKKHPQQQVIDELREILLEMGFVEIKSRIVESEFWNFDALFQAQDHPAREIHDSLSVKTPSQTKLPSAEILNKVIKAHEKGVAGSTGWGYRFNREISQRPVLCSQTTAATVRYLASKPEPPVKIFCIDRVYRHEKIDYKHLTEFYQCEGIVMDEGLTLRDMLGYLKEIVTKLGLPKIRFRPGYFPYTEPSVEADVYFPEKGEWLEVLGAGMFRPELLRPLGINHPVLAWGIGFSRLAMIKLGIEDIRDLYKNDLEWLQTKRMI